VEGRTEDLKQIRNETGKGQKDQGAAHGGNQREDRKLETEKTTRRRVKKRKKRKTGAKKSPTEGGGRKVAGRALGFMANQKSKSKRSPTKTRKLLPWIKNTRADALEKKKKNKTGGEKTKRRETGLTRNGKGGVVGEKWSCRATKKTR